jgi:hypothetical protein
VFGGGQLVLHRKIGRDAQLRASLASEFARTVPSQENRALRFHHSRDHDRIAYAADHSHRSDRQIRSVHQRRAHFDVARCVWNRTMAGIERRIVLEHPHRCFNRGDGAAAICEHQPAGGQSAHASIAVGRFILRRDMLRAAMDGERPCTSICVGHFIPPRAGFPDAQQPGRMA